MSFSCKFIIGKLKINNFLDYEIRYRESFTDKDWIVIRNYVDDAIVLRKLKSSTSYDVNIRSVRTGDLESPDLYGSHSTRDLKVKGKKHSH